MRDWRRLEGVKVEGTNPGENGKAALEGAFLLSSSWETAVRSSIDFGKRRGARFPIEAAMVVDFGGYAGGDANPALLVNAKTDAVFKGLSVHQGRAKDVSAAKKIVADLLDLAAFEEPVDRGKGSFFFAPLLTDAERAEESGAAAAQIEANKRPGPPPPAREKLCRGLWLVPVDPPAKRVVQKVRAPVPGLVKGTVRRPGSRVRPCRLAWLEVLRVPVHQGPRAEAQDGRRSRQDASDCEAPGDRGLPRRQHYRDMVGRRRARGVRGCTLPGGAAFGPCHPRLAAPRARGSDASGPCRLLDSHELESALRAGQLVVCTRERVAVLEERSGKLRVLAQHRVETGGGATVFGEGRFVLVRPDHHSPYLLLGLKGRKLHVLAKFKCGGNIEERGGRLYVEKYEKGRYYALEGHEELLTRAK